jgi:hypothetical protein
MIDTTSALSETYSPIILNDRILVTLHDELSTMVAQSVGNLPGSMHKSPNVLVLPLVDDS